MIGTTAVNGKIIMNPGIGTMVSGYNLHVVKRAGAVIRCLHETMEEIEQDPAGMKEMLGKEARIKVQQLDLSIHRIDKWPFFAVYENNSKRYIEKDFSISR